MHLGTIETLRRQHDPAASSDRTLIRLFEEDHLEPVSIEADLVCRQLLRLATRFCGLALRYRMAAIPKGRVGCMILRQIHRWHHQSKAVWEVSQLSRARAVVTEADEKINDLWLRQDLMLNAWAEPQSLPYVSKVRSLSQRACLLTMYWYKHKL